MRGYNGLSLADRYHRFFSRSMSTHFIEQWAHVADQGGVGLVAVVANGATRQNAASDAGIPRECLCNRRR